MVLKQMSFGLNSRKSPTSPDFFQWKGHESTIPHEDRTTIAFQNVHGLKTKHTELEAALYEIVDNMEHHNIDMLGISEHHMALSNHTARQKLYETIRKIRPSRIMHQFNSAPDSDYTARLVGGTGILALGSITGRVQPGGRAGDPMGRWSVVHMRRYHRPPITVISIYQVCPTPTNAIGDTAWHQQRRFLDLHNRTEHPREAFSQDLIKYIQELQQKQHAIIVGGDWNDWLGANRSQLLKMCTSLQLIDPWTTRHPTEVDFATYEQGKHRIDALFISQELQQAVTAVRYTPGGLFCSTDHRAVVIEFHTRTLFGNTQQQPPTHASRSLRSNDKRAVTSFIESMYSHLLHQNAFERSKQLELHDTSNHELVEQIDNLIGEAGDIGEKKVQRRRPPWYSSQIAMKRHIVSLLRHYTKGLKANIDRSAVIQQRLHKIQVNVYLPTTTAAAIEMLQQHEKELRECVKNSEKQRIQHLSQTATAAETLSKPQKARAIRQINKCEQNLKTWKILTFMANKGKTQKLDQLDIPMSWPPLSETFDPSITLEDPKQASEWRTIIDTNEIEQYLLLRNYQHFGQAHGTPFTMPPLCDDINWEATTQEAEDILMGTYNNATTLTHLCKQVLHQCKASTRLNCISDFVTAAEFQGKMKVWNERTTTSPSGRHLGRYKALFAKGVFLDSSNEGQALQVKQQEILKVILRIINYCIQTEYPLRRWCKTINTMIFKDHGVFRIHRLRVIHIFEADLNLVYATKWRQLIRHADSNCLLHPGQYGGRPGYEASSMALLEELRIDAAFLTRRTLMTFDNDAASCYDRIIINLASLVNRKNGLHHKITALHGKILASTEYTLRTGNGESNAAYGNSRNSPLYGTGQGAGNSPGIWLLISSTLFDAYDIDAHGACFTSQDKTITLQMGLTGFVDDTNAVANTFYPQHDDLPEVVRERLRQDAQLWTDILHISGGKLELSKCSYHALQFTFKADGTPTPVATMTHPPLDLIDPATSQIVSVPCLPASQAHKILGHWKSPCDPKQKAQLNALVHKAQHQSLLIAASPLSRHGSRLAYMGQYVASLRYVLPQCWFPTQVLDRAEKKSMQRIIPKCGYAHTTPHALLYAPLELAGAGFLHWRVLQGEGQVRHFLKHWRTQTYESQLLRVTLSWSQWQAGTGVSILNDVTTQLPHLEGHWIPSLRTFLSTIKGTIKLDMDFVPQSERQGDRPIMDIALQSGHFSPADLRYLNYCRLYLHVYTISDIIDATGTKITRHAFECERPSWFDPTTCVVIQRKPSRYQRHYQWKRFCRMLCTEDLQVIDKFRISRWLQPANRLRLRREAYMEHHPVPRLFVWKEDSYWMATAHPTIPDNYQVAEPTEWQPTVTSTPIDIIQHYSPRRCLVATTAATKRYIYPSKAPPPCEFSEYVHTLPEWEKELLSHISWDLEPFEMIHVLHSQWSDDDRLLVVSDGSSIESTTMSYGVVIGTDTGRQMVEVMGPANGHPSSHRAECTGALAGAVLLYHLQKFTRTTLPSNILALVMSDNQGMIQRLQSRGQYTNPYPNTTLLADWDLIEEIHKLHDSLWKGTHTYEWIRGHQDDNTLQPLPPAARYNVRADHLAGEYTYMIDGHLRPKTHIMNHTGCILNMNNAACHGHYTAALRRAAAEPEYFAYLRKRHQWSDATLAQIDWPVFRQASRTFSSTEIHLLKLVHDKLPTNLQKSHYYKWVNPQCHFCREPETFNHLCTSTCNPRSISFRTKVIEAVDDYFTANDTPQLFRNAFADAINQWLNEHDHGQKSQLRGPLSLHNSQKDIGWPLLARGFLSVQWRSFLRYTVFLENAHMWGAMNTIPDEDTSAATEDTDGPQYWVDFEEESATPPEHSRIILDPTRHLAKVVQIIWHEMGQLWNEHLTHLHKDSIYQSPEKQNELHTQIRMLHAAKDQTLAAHRDRYFFPDIDKYLEKASNLQMMRYVDRYRPAILHSIKQAARLATTSTRPLTSFVGFSRNIRQTQTNPPTTREETPHRKHTRIRTGIPQKITEFFKVPRPLNNRTALERHKPPPPDPTSP